MKTKLILMTFSVFMMLFVSTCSGDTKTSYANHDSLAVSYASENVEETVLSEDSGIYRANYNIKLNIFHMRSEF